MRMIIINSLVTYRLIIEVVSMTNTLSLNKDNSQHETTLSVTNLLKGKRYAWISHAGETYLLQLTKSNKLLLTK